MEEFVELALPIVLIVFALLQDELLIPNSKIKTQNLVFLLLIIHWDFETDMGIQTHVRRVLRCIWVETIFSLKHCIRV